MCKLEEKINKRDLTLGSDRRSLDRPAWTTFDREAYKHKHKNDIIKNYYVKKAQND